MTEQRRPRRTVPVVILDAILGVATALHLGPRGREGDAPRRPAVRWIVAGVAAVAAVTLTMVIVFLRSPDGMAPLGVATPPPAPAEPTAAASSPSASASPGVERLGASPAPVGGAGGDSGTPGPPTVRPTEASPVPLTARFALADGGQGLVGYRASVTITNPGGSPAAGWLLTVTLPRPTLMVTNVSGAVARKDGATWTFTPVEGAPDVPGGGSTAVSFDVRGATLVDSAPTACTIDGKPCTGLPGGR